MVGKLKQIFNADSHCGAKKRAGDPCLNPKGLRTDHPGTGRCFLHAGRSTGAKTLEGKAIVRGNGEKHGLYSNVLTAGDRVRLDTVQEYTPSEILKGNFYLVQSKLLRVLEGDCKGLYGEEESLLLQAANILVEEGQISPEFVADLKLKLVNLDVLKIAQVMNSTVNLINAATHHDRQGDTQKQLAIAINFLRTAVRVGDRTIKELGLAAISELKAEAGLPVEQIEALLQSMQQQDELMLDESDRGEEGAIACESEAFIDVAVDDSGE